MSGHSKWATTKHKKAIVDAKRGKVFTKVIKELTIAAKIGGGDPDANPRLRMAMSKAKECNMPQNNIKKAIQKGTGEIPGVSYEEITYEGYGPGGVALMITATTDNKNRTVAEIRYILSKNNGSMGESGSVSWIFTQKGYFSVSTSAVDEEKLMDLVLEAGAEDFTNEESIFEIYSPPAAFEDVKEAIESNNIPIEVAEISMIPSNYVSLQDKEAIQMLKLMDQLEDNEDVQDVYANFDIAENIIEEFHNN